MSECSQVEVAKLKDGSVDWSLRSKTATTSIYEGRHDNAPIFLARTEIEATLEDAIAVFFTTTVEATRRLQADFQPLVLDKVRLCNLTLPSTKNPYLYQSLNWSIITTPFPGMIVKKRDFSFLEVQSTSLLDIEGRTAYVRLMKSVAIPGVPDLERHYDVIRGELLHNAFLFIETDRPRVLELISIYHTRPNGQVKGAVGDFVLSKSTKSHYKTIEDTERVVRAYQLSRLTFLDQFCLPPLNSRTKCDICIKVFGNSRKVHCRHCAKVVCPHDCSAEWNLVKSGLSFTVRICVLCSKHVGSLPSNHFTTPRDPTESITSWTSTGETMTFSKPPLIDSAARTSLSNSSLGLKPAPVSTPQMVPSYDRSYKPAFGDFRQYLS
ncbi:hypothetical protein LEN26_017573 [Aphanomyces euteiches]|nr:hypothetical protein LEN26_017573 [Aphanomyces euteiches]KAH9111298.1 hypothetical protein AeMF1_014139 [Aphanomyces euteiches]KAH9164794.1 hypothetical protein AeNC1_018635 [Aphanomyces euteiches]